MELHKDLTMQLHNFSHEHQLILKSEGTKGNTLGEEINRICNGCTLPIFSRSPLYTCEECNQFSLHKTCAELPMELEYHHKHIDFNLTLQSKSPYFFRCYSCGNSVMHKFYYRCKRCRLVLDITCASSDHFPEINTIQHRSHPRHPLELLGRPALLLCDGCGEEHRGHFYMCNSCRFYIHQNCVSFPRSIKRGDHHAHSLALSYSNPIGHDSWEDICVICRKSCYERFWMYWCSRCIYAAHLKCAMSKIEPFMSILLPRVNHRKSNYNDHLIRLPPANEFVSVVGHLTTSTNYGNVMGLKEVPALIEVNDLMCHQHPLVFLDNESGSSIIESFLFGPDRNYFSNVPQCDVCFRAVSPPFYCCKICNLFFHQICSKLPSTIQHPFYPEHTFILLPRDPRRYVGLFSCPICGKDSNGVCYYSRTCEISLDVKCALLPRNIIHESHPSHVLALGDKEPSKGSKNCCRFSISCRRKGYTCDTCDFGMHVDCALYPSTVRHTYDEHELKLVYDPSQANSDDPSQTNSDDPSQANSDEYYCQICELRIDQRNWFYHCVECDRSFHIYCNPPDNHIPFRITAIPSIGFYQNMKFGITFKFDFHPHTLTFVQHLEGSPCNLCGKPICPDDSLAFECSKCNYVFHLHCSEHYEDLTGQPEE